MSVYCAINYVFVEKVSSVKCLDESPPLTTFLYRRIIECFAKRNEISQLNQIEERGETERCEREREEKNEKVIYVNTIQIFNNVSFALNMA